MKVSAVIPAYNEAKTIAPVVGEVKGKVNQVIVVDDGSTDQTGHLAQAAGAEVITHFLNRGKGEELKTGINFALNSGADLIVTFDADGQHDAQDISRITEPLLLGQVDVVLGSRFLNLQPKTYNLKPNNIPWFRVLVLKTATFFTRLYTGLKITDTHNGLRAFSRLAVQKIEIKHDGMAHASEIIEQIKKHQLKFKEVPVNINYTAYSLEKGQKLTNSFRIIWDLIIGKISSK